MDINRNELLDMMKFSLERDKDTILLVDYNEKIVITEKIDFTELLKQLYDEVNIPIEILEDDAIKRFVFKHDLFFLNVTFKENVFFNNIIFEGEINSVFDMNYVNFEKEASYEYTIFGKKCHFDSVKFENANFKNTKFKKEVKFFNIDFQGGVDFSTAKFNSETNFNNVNFFKKVFFLNTIFNKISFVYNTFNDDVYFEDAIINDDICFKDTTFNVSVDFKKITVMKTLLFDNIKLRNESHIFFENTSKGIPDYYYKNTEIKIIDTLINGRIDFNSDRIKLIDLKGSAIAGSGTLNMVNFNPECANYQTVTILKNEEIKRNNIIKALEYKAEEKELYAKYLRTSDKYEKDKEKDFKDKDNFCGLKIVYICLKIKLTIWFERFSIWLNKKSNNHGQSWGRAVFFTIGVWIVSFGIFYAIIPIELLNISQTTTALSVFTPELIKYFNPTNYELLIEYLKTPIANLWCRIFGIIIYFAGKILIAYGIVGTVQAFRKFK